MKGMKGKLMKKLKTVKQINYLKPDRILKVSALDGFVENVHLKSAFVDNFHTKSAIVDNFPFKSQNKAKSPELQTKSQPSSNPKKNLEEPEIIHVAELMKDLEEEENDDEFRSENQIDDKENISPFVSKGIDGGGSDAKQMPLNELEISSFRRPDMDSGSLFDPNLLAAFKEAVTEHVKTWEGASQAKPKSQNQTHPFFNSEYQTDPLLEFEDQTDPLVEFEEKCPPGGSDSVILYTTSLRGIRKTFEDCQSIRFLLESFRVIYYERDVSIHLEFRDELWRIMGEKILPPILFIKGRYIGGAEKVLVLHEQGRLRPLFRDIPIDFSEGPCNGCSGLRFALCLNCNGSKKLFDPDQGSDNEFWSKCPECNENGLIVCPFCS